MEEYLGKGCSISRCVPASGFLRRLHSHRGLRRTARNSALRRSQFCQCCRKNQRESAAFIQFTRHVDPAAVQPGDVLSKRESKPGALNITDSRITAAVEPLEQFRNFLLCDSDAGVYHMEADFMPVMFGLEPDFPAIWCVFDRVAKQVDEGRQEFVLVNIQFRQARWNRGFEFERFLIQQRIMLSWTSRISRSI